MSIVITVFNKVIREKRNLYYSPKNALGNLSNLKKLNLSSCDVKKLLETMTNLKSLGSLSLPYYISYIPEWIGTLANLKELEISVYNVKEIPIFIKNLKRLKILRVFSSHSLRSKEWLKGLPNLEKLEFY